MRPTLLILAVFLMAETAVLLSQPPETVEAFLADLTSAEAAEDRKSPHPFLAALAATPSAPPPAIAADDGMLDMHPALDTSVAAVLVHAITHKTVEHVSQKQTVSYMLFFGHDDDRLDPASRDALTAIAARARFFDPGSLHILITGHTDRKGMRAYNRQLSKRRAQAVRKALIHLGVRADRVTLVGLGESAPRVATPDGHPSPGNRRAVVTLGPASTL